jgi:hypothetical protein
MRRCRLKYICDFHGTLNLLREAVELRIGVSGDDYPVVVLATRRVLIAVARPDRRNGLADPSAFCDYD